MKHGIKRTMALFGCLLTLSACSGPVPDEKRPAMGRYVEESLPLPEEMASMQYLGLQGEGNFLLIGETAQEVIKVWSSTDGGASWNTQSPGWLETLKSYDPYAMTVDKEGNLWFTNEIKDPTIDALYEQGNQEAIDAYVPPLNPLYTVLNGAAVLQSQELQSDRGNQAGSFFVEDEYIAAYWGEIGGFDRESGGMWMAAAETEEYLMPGDYFLEGGTLAVSDGGIMKLYRAEDGEPTGEIPFQAAASGRTGEFFGIGMKGRNPIADTPEAGVYAYCNGNGIFRVSSDGLLHEKVVAGELCALSMPTVSIQRLFVEQDAYYVYVTDLESLPWQLSGAALLRYRYNETVPSEPTTELRVYSLLDLPTVRQTIGLFQREHPEVRVKFDVAAGTESGVDLSDAMRVLSTELLAGNGPDVLILDGLPLASYVEKGVLMDFGSRLSPELKDQLFSNLLKSNGKDGAMYAIPARFSIPMILGTPETLEAVGDLEGLTECVTGLDSPQIGIPPSELFELLYPLFFREWFRADGSLDEETTAAGLEQISRMLRLYEGKNPDLLWNARGDANAGAIGWAAGWTPFFLHNLTSFEQLDVPSAVERDFGAVYTPYPSLKDAVIYPKATVGIRAGSAHQDLAVQFLESMLSRPVQSLTLGDGLPVNRDVALEVLQSPRELAYHQYGVGFSDEFEGGAEKQKPFPYSWPEDAYFEGFMKTIESVETWLPLEESLKRIFAEETAPYFSGTRPLEETVKALKQKVDLWMAEQS